MNKLKYLGYSIVFQEVPGEVTLAINISGCPHKCEGCHSKYLWEYDGHYVSDDLEDLIKKYNLKVALYSGLDDDGTSLTSLHKKFDYIKLGHYDKTLGGLNQKTTNQRMYQRVNDILEDITYKFWKEDKTNDSN